MTNAPETSAKLDTLRKQLRGLGSLLVAYSGGVDSTFLMRITFDELGPNALAVTAASQTYPHWERQEAIDMAKRFGWRHKLYETSEIDIPGFAENPADRCFYCKSELFSSLWEIARREGMNHVADGTTADDLNDFRPGRRAAKELKILSPLLEAGLTKDEIRGLSQGMDLPTWDKPSFACLASRFPYGKKITEEKLQQVEAAEEFLRRLGIKQCRVRHHGEIARIEVSQEDIPILSTKWRDEIAVELKRLGFAYVTLDLAGYRTGSMNEVLDKDILQQDK